MAKDENKNVAKVEKKKSDKPGLFARAGKFFREVIGEVKKLSWLSRKDLISYTLTVFAFIAVFSIIIYACDFLFAEGLNLLAKI